MKLFWIILSIAAVLCLVAVLGAYICYRMAFYSPKRKPKAPDVIDIPEGEIYEVYREDMEKWARMTRAMPHEDVEITSFDGLTLRGKYYEYAPGAPIELMLHGYRGSAERDMPGGALRSHRVGRSALVVDQRASGSSDGSVISFGINERRDCLSWVEFMIQKFGPEVKIILTGISMGGATVMMAAGEDLPDNVIGILSDCGFSSPKEIICKVIRQLGLPARPLYPLVKLGAKLFGRFDLEETSALEALKRSKKPVIFFHGESDDFVPCEMSKACFDACASYKRLVTVPNAGHGLAYPVDPERYIRELKDFFGPEASADLQPN